MMLDFKPNFEKTVKATKDLNDAAVEYIDGIEVIKAFSKTESSYERFTTSAKAYAILLFHGCVNVLYFML